MEASVNDVAGQRRFLWGYCYRLTGSAADADDIVQETMLRAMERPPARLSDMRPWLVRVATNLGRDLLRARRRQGYVGPWLPSPIEEADIDIPVEARGAEGRYDLVESVSFAFLIALEALKPRERAVLLLADVFDYSIREIAEALDVSESNAKVLHHRAKKKLSSYDRERAPRDVARSQRTRIAFERFLASITADDRDSLEALLAPEVRALNDGGGEFFAARRPILGPSRVARFYLGLKKKFTQPTARFSFHVLNGSPAIAIAQEGLDARFAPITVTSLTTDDSGRIDRLYSFLATSKLTRVKSMLSARA